MNQTVFGQTFNPSNADQATQNNFRTKDKVPKGYESYQMQQFTPEQMGLFQQLFSNVSANSYLSRLAGGDQSLFQDIEAPAHRQFQGELGNIASRFSGMGMGGRRSSGFQNTATAAASNFAQDLQSQRMQLQRQAIMDLMGMSESLLGQRPYLKGFTQKQDSAGPLGGWGPAIGAGLGGLGGFFAGGPAGALPGATFGQNLLSGF